MKALQTFTDVELKVYSEEYEKIIDLDQSPNFGDSSKHSGWGSVASMSDISGNDHDSPFSPNINNNCLQSLRGSIEMEKPDLRKRK